MLIRFRKSDGTEYPQWEEYIVESQIEELSLKTTINNEYPILSSTHSGIKLQNEYFNKQTASEDNVGYKIVPYGYFTYRAMSDTGKFVFNQQTLLDKGIVSPAYPVFKVIESNADYFRYFMNESKDIKSQILILKEGSTRFALPASKLKKLKIKLPCIEEQQKIANFLSTVDQKIESQKAIVADYEDLKKGTMQKIFNQEIRFKDDNGNEFPEWEEKKLGDTLLIQRGGSPRPISSYITDREDGLNWIKIGDVSPNTNVIKSTKEKIIPEGLKKTRQVFVGDLILSNSMSFGRPYILEINGCIHDGWLLIRKYKKSFDREFLCYLLASDKVKKQYEKLSAGSTVQNLNSELVQSVKANIPCIEEQKKIADCLSALDRKIEAEKRILADLEELKRGLLQAIFNN